MVDLDGTAMVVDNRPHEQRAIGPRAARRMNHAFKYLYRHDSDKHMNSVESTRGLANVDDGTNPTLSSSSLSAQFLMQHVGYSAEEIDLMNQTFPPLLGIDVDRHLRPKLRFLMETCGATTEEIRTRVAPQFFGSRLERIIAPRHAFLVYRGLPHGRQLLDDANMWQEFFASCRKPKQFVALCNQWRQKFNIDDDDNVNDDRRRAQAADSAAYDPPRGQVTVKQVEAFDALFRRGLMPAARNELCQWNNTWPMDYLPTITTADMTGLLIQHGANPLDRDNRGATLLHWAAGSGNLGCVKLLLRLFKDGVFTETDREGATPLHWAAAGRNSSEFGIGGHLNVIRYLVEQTSGDDKRRLINKLTRDGNSVLMWAAWSSSLDEVKYLVRNRADPTLANRNGCTVAHWASSGGNLEVCQYLAEKVGIDFSLPNHGGNTPLTHAVAFGRVEVVQWLRDTLDQNAKEQDGIAANLAKDFVSWTDGADQRKEILSLFQDWYGEDENDTGDDDNGSDDDIVD